jgi:hypothetical protein
MVDMRSDRPDEGNLLNSNSEEKVNQIILSKNCTEGGGDEISKELTGKLTLLGGSTRL